MIRTILLSLSVLFLACKNDETSQPVPTGDYDQFVDEEGVTRSEPARAFQIIQYNTRIDTTISGDEIIIRWDLLTSSSDSIAATWTAPQGVVIENRFEKKWDQSRQKWLAGHLAKLTPNPGSWKISVTMKNNASGKIYIRSQEVTISKKIESFDIFRLNFGMSKSEVKANDLPRLELPDVGSSWHEAHSDLATAPKSPFSDWYGATQYGFKEGKLFKVKDINNEGFVYKEHILIIKSLIAKYGIDGAPELTSDGKSIKNLEKGPVVWTVNGLKLTFEQGKLNEYPTVKKSYWMAVEKAQ